MSQSLKYRLDVILQDGERCRFIDEPVVTLAFRAGTATLVVEISPHLNGVEATLTQPPNEDRVAYTLDDVYDFLREMDEP